MVASRASLRLTLLHPQQTPFVRRHGKERPAIHVAVMFDRAGSTILPPFRAALGTPLDGLRRLDRNNFDTFDTFPLTIDL